VNLLGEFRPSVSSLSIHERRVFSTELVLRATCDVPCNLQGTTFSRCPSMNFEGLSFLRFSFTTFESLQETLARTPCGKSSTRLSVEVFDPAHSCSRNLSIPLLRIATLSLRLACACLAWLWCQICTSENLEQKLLSI
jgi:hypothetical protein